jgi:transposase InsO family protein
VGVDDKAEMMIDERKFDLTMPSSRHSRSVKYEDIYIKDYSTIPALERGLSDYFYLYNHQRPHQSLAYRTPAAVHFAAPVVVD